MTRAADAPAERAQDLQRRIRAHKAAIRRHREELRADAQELAELKQQYAARGIRLVVHNGSNGAGGIHGQEGNGS